MFLSCKCGWLVVIFTKKLFLIFINQYESKNIIFRHVLHFLGVEDVRLLEQGPKQSHYVACVVGRMVVIVLCQIFLCN